MAEREGRLPEIDFNLPKEVYKPHTDPEKAVEIQASQITIAGFVARRHPKVHDKWQLEKPLFLIDGKPARPSQERDGIGYVEYYCLTQNLYWNWVLRAGWDNLVMTPEAQVPRLWVSLDPNIATYIFERREGLPYNSKTFKWAFDAVARSAQAAEHIANLGLAPHLKRRASP